MPNFFINVKEKGAKKAAGNIGTLTGSMKKMVAQAAIAGVAMETMRKAIVRSAEIEGVRRGFDNLAKSAGFSSKAFDNFKKATDGTIDNLTLMKKANAAMLLGITDSEDQMADMFDVAQRLGQSLGIDTVQSIDSLVTGMGRQSKLMLDNLGIMVDTNKSYKDYAEANNIAVSAMTDAERKQAFVNAAMKEANFLVEQLGAEQLNTKDKIAQMNTALLESLTAFGNLLTPLVIPFAEALGFVATQASELMDIVSGVNNEFSGTASTLTGFNRLLKENAGDEEWLANKTKELNAEQKKLREELAGLTSTGSQAIGFTKDFALSIDLSSDSMVDYNKNMLITEQQYGDLIQSIVDGTFNLDEFKKMQEETTIGTINNNTERAKAIQFLIDEAERKKELIAVTKDEGKAEVMTSKKKKELTDKELIGYAKASGSAEDAMKSVVRAETMEAVAGFIASILKTVPFPLNAVLAAGAGATVGGLVDKGLASFATGGDFITNGEQLIRVGDNPSGREHVQITPLGGDPAPNAPSGGSVTVNVSGNVLTEDFVSGELAENIKEAVRRGTDFGIG